MQNDGKVTVAVHVRSGTRLHVIDRAPMPSPQPQQWEDPGSGVLTRLPLRRGLAIALLALTALYVVISTSYSQVPSLQQVHDQLLVAKAAGKDCEMVPWRAQQAIVAALAPPGADEPALHHPAWEAHMEPAVLDDCGLLQLAQATTYATQSDFLALQAQVAAIQKQITAMQAQLAALSPAPPSPPPPPPKPALVNSAANSAYVGSSTLSLSVPLNATSGNLLVVSCSAAQTQATTVTDTAGNTFVAAVSVTSGPAPAGQWGPSFTGLWYAKNISGSSSDVITCNYGGQADQGIVALQYSGIDKTSPLDATASGTGTGTDFATSPFSTTSASEVIVASGMNTAGSGSPFMPGAGFTMQQQTYTYYIVEDQITTSMLNNVTATMTQPASSAWTIVAASFKAGS